MPTVTPLRVVIAGGTSAGKTTLAQRIGITMRSTDDFKAMPWNDSLDAVARWFDLPGPWCVEGVKTAAALRRWLRVNHTGKPCDLAIFLDGARLDLTPKQRSFNRAIATIWAEIEPALRKRGVTVEIRKTADKVEARKLTQGAVCSTKRATLTYMGEKE